MGTVGQSACLILFDHFGDPIGWHWLIVDRIVGYRLDGLLMSIERFVEFTFTVK